MPSDKTRKTLLDIFENIARARSFTDRMSYEEFRNNIQAFYATTRALEIISEASRRLPEPLKARHPHIPWSDVAGAGNIYRHNYEDVQQRLVWGTVTNRLQELWDAVSAELGGED